MKRWMYIPLSLAVSLSLLTGCADTGTGNTGSSEEITASTDGSAGSSEDAASSTDGSAGDSEDAASSTDESVDDSGSSEASSADASDTGADPAQTDADLFTDRDYETDYEESGSVMIQLNGDTATASSDSVQISGTDITITEEADYIISGTLDDGRIIVNAPDTAKLRLVLNGVTINSETSAPLYIFEADKVFVTLADGTENILSNGGTFTVASGDDAFHGEETLTVTAGTIDITESYEGLEALDIRVEGGDITLVASDDGLNAAGGTDSSGTTGGRDGRFGGGPGGNGGGTGGNGGGMSSSSDGSIVISGGSLQINASCDGIDANGSVTISGGYTVVTGPTQGDTATLDYDVSAVITGGTFIGTGASGMAQTFSDSEQGVVSVSTGSQSAGTAVTLADQEGNTLITCTPEESFQVVILSSPDLVSGETYTVTVGKASAEVEAT